MRLGFVGSVWTLGIFVLLQTLGSAGPSFNSNRGELAALSRDAGASLNRAVAEVHLMLESLEQLKPEVAEQRRADALKSLEAAIASFQQISERAPQQKLIMEPHTDVEKHAVDALPAALKYRHIEFPKTEKELAQLATKLVSDFRVVVAGSQRFDKTSTKAYGYFQNLFREEGFLLNVGISTSIIWAMQEASPK